MSVKGTRVCVWGGWSGISVHVFFIYAVKIYILLKLTSFFCPFPNMGVRKF